MQRVQKTLLASTAIAQAEWPDASVVAAPLPSGTFITVPPFPVVQ